MDAAIEHGVPAGRMLGNGVGSTAQAIGNGVGGALTGLANVAVEHGVPAARATLTGLAYKGSDAFRSLVDRLVEGGFSFRSLPEVPALSCHTEDTLASYSNLDVSGRRALPQLVRRALPQLVRLLSDRPSPLTIPSRRSVPLITSPLAQRMRGVLTARAGGDWVRSSCSDPIS